jgi:hypothetical protein
MPQNEWPSKGVSSGQFEILNLNTTNNRNITRPKIERVMSPNHQGWRGTRKNRNHSHQGIFLVGLAPSVSADPMFGSKGI